MSRTGKLQYIFGLIMGGFSYQGFRLSVPKRLYELPQKCERRRGHGCAKVMLEREITNEIGGGKVICSPIIAAWKVWGKGRKYVGYQKSDTEILRSRPGDEQPRTPFSLNLPGQCQKGSRSNITWTVHNG
jgi:hypothetical protein